MGRNACQVCFSTVATQYSCNRPAAPSSASILAALGGWAARRYDFYKHPEPLPIRLCLYRKHQQDRLQFEWSGFVAGTDGSVQYKTERMGAGLVVTEGPGERIVMVLSAAVGGPLASLRPEATSLLHLLRNIRQKNENNVALLVFVNCLALLHILAK